MAKKNMNHEAAKRIQSSQDKKGTQGDKGFVSRSMKSANKKNSSNTGKQGSKK